MKSENKFASFILSMLVSGFIFAIIAIPLFSPFLFQDSSESDSKIITNIAGKYSLFLAFYDEVEFIPLYVTIDFSQNAISVKTLSDNATKEEYGKTCGECYSYGGASYLLPRISERLAEKPQKFVILHKKSAENLLDFIGGTIVSKATKVYNSKTTQNEELNIFGPDLFKYCELLGYEKVIKSFVYSILGDSKSQLIENLSKLTTVADTNLTHGEAKILAELIY